MLNLLLKTLSALFPRAFRGRGRFSMLCFSALASAVGVIVGLQANPPGGPPPLTAPPPPTSRTSAPATGLAGGTATPLDEPLRLIGEAQRAYQDVKDYSCTLIKHERVRNQMQPDQVMQMRFRKEPFSVYLRWSDPLSMNGQEVCYVAGKNRGNMRVHAKGLAGVVGFVSIDPNDPRVMENSRHNITQAGIGNLIEQFARGYEQDRTLGKTQVRVANYEYNKRPCTRIETIHPEQVDGKFQHYGSVLYLDQQTHLPVRVENYDWPRKGGSPHGEQLEVFSFLDIQTNLGLGDDVFNK